MKILNCPLNGPRNISEFACLGEVKPIPAPAAGVSEWADFAFTESQSGRADSRMVDPSRDQLRLYRRA